MLRFLLILSLAALALANDPTKSCLETSDCDYDEDNAKCIKEKGCRYGVCGCKDNFFLDTVAETCKEITWKKIGESCDLETNQCDDENIDHIMCDWSGTKKCVCKDGMTANGDDKCEFGDKKIGDACTYARECAAYQHHYEKWEDHEVPYATLDPTSQSAIVTCTGGTTVCTCASGWKANSDNTECEIDLKGPGEACNAGECDLYTVPGLTCGSGGTCQCASGYEYFEDVWQYYTKYDQVCLQTDSEINLGKKKICGSSYNSAHVEDVTATCGKGLKCKNCNGCGLDICLDSASGVAVSFVLLLAALLVQKLL